MTDAAPAIRPAATLLLLRDQPEFQVLMVERHRQVEFAAGALVFPGGKIDDADADPGWRDVVAGWDATPQDERPARIAALRETFEESGVLVGAPGLAPERRAAARRDLASGRIGFRAIVAALAPGVDLGALALFSRWITPEVGRQKRFDTWFYLAQAPRDDAALHDGGETVAAEWIAPREALRLSAEGARTVVLPTRLNLAKLADSATVGEAIAAARARIVAPVTPLVERDEGGTRLRIPREAGYGDVCEPFMLPRRT